MAFVIIEAQYDIKETVNGYRVKKKLHYIPLELEDSQVKLDIPMIGPNGNILCRALFSGPLVSKVTDIIKIFSKNTLLLLKICDRTKILKNDSTPLLKVFEIRDGSLRKSSRYSLIAFPVLDIPMISSYVYNINFLRKLTIMNINISKITLSILYHLKYLKLTNIGLKNIITCPRTLEYCNLSNNFLKKCSIKSKVLILSHNQLSSLEYSERFNFLNVSFNPLEYIACNVKFLLIKQTKIKSLFNCSSQIIIADGTCGIKIGECPNLRILSLNNCGLSKITFPVSNIEMFFAGNNYLQILPRFKKCRYIDVSGNFLESFKNCKATVINVSKNQLRYFDFTRLSSLKHINISFNPIDQPLFIPGDPILKTVLVNTTQRKYFNSDIVKTQQGHNCLRSNSFLHHYKLEITKEDIPITVFVLVKTVVSKDASNIIGASFDTLFDSNSSINLFYDFSDQIYTEWRIMDPRVSILFTLITDRDVMVRSFYLPAIFYNFAELEEVSDPKIARVFFNSSAWCVFPLFCKPKNLMKKRNYLLSNEKVDFNEIFEFLNCFCTKGMNYNVPNSPEYLNVNKNSRTSVCRLIKPIQKLSSLPVIDNFDMLNDFLIRCSHLGLLNHDFGSNIRRSDIVASITAAERPIFLFSKFLFGSDKNRLIKIEKFNIFRIFDFYCHVFGGIVAEKNYGTYIIRFKAHFHAALFALKIEKLLKILGMEICIGITTGLVFSSQHDGILYLGGPVFNKASRLADMGTGIYCCSCIKLQHPLIELHDEGERYLKGFDSSHRIFSLKLGEIY